MTHTCTWRPTVLFLIVPWAHSGVCRLWVFRGGVSNHTQQELWRCWQNRVEPFGRSVAFTAVSGLSWPLRGLGGLGGLRGLRGLRGRGGHVLLLIDLLHLRPLTAGLLLPVCSTVDEIRKVRHHKHTLLVVLAYTIWFYSGSTDSNYRSSNHRGPCQTAGRRPPPSCLLHCGWNQDCERPGRTRCTVLLMKTFHCGQDQDQDQD